MLLCFIVFFNSFTDSSSLVYNNGTDIFVDFKGLPTQPSVVLKALCSIGCLKFSFFSFLRTEL